MKRFAALAATALLLILTACNNTHENSSPESESSSSSTSSSNSSSSSESSASISTSSSTSSGSSPESLPQGSADAAPDAPSEEREPALPDGFNISNYITDFEDTELCGCSYISELSFPQADVSAVEKAVEAYKSSYLYSDVVEELSEMYRYENDELILNEEYELHNRAHKLREYIDETAAPEIALKTETLKSYKTVDGNLVMLRTALHLEWQDWSGSARCYIPVYVNADGEAHILYDAISQDYGGFELMSCNGSIFAMFNFGHNQGSQRGAICSFKDGKPKTELSGCPFSIYNGLLLGGYGWDCFEPYMYDEKSGEFCALAGVSPSEELAELICSDKLIRALVPDAWESYQKGRLQIIGGTYVTFITGIPWNDSTFVYNGSSFELVEPVTATDSPIPKQITRVCNIKL